MTRQTGDSYILALDSNWMAYLTYQPGPYNRKARAETIDFRYSRLIAGIISTYISNRFCSEELKRSCQRR